MAVRQIRDVEKSRRHTNLHTHAHTQTHIFKPVMHLIYNFKAWDVG